ncbi:cupin domain-containing protein [Virgibacillus sp. W0181]|uniref:cupin domain-containing protein n=1 Tax=Virgibacillus sp. W0181 TaxID=3391581 RepID=UPI003F4508F8
MTNEWEQVDLGVKRKIFPPGESIMMMKVHFEKEAEGKLHNHHHEQFTYVLEGEFKFFIDDREQIVKAGETIFIPSNCKHGVLALEEGVLLDTFTPLREDLLKA